MFFFSMASITLNLHCMHLVGEPIADIKGAFAHYDAVRLLCQATHFLGVAPSQSKHPIETESVLHLFTKRAFEKLREFGVYSPDNKPVADHIFELDDFEQILDMFVWSFSKADDFLDKIRWVDLAAPLKELLADISGCQLRHPYAQKKDCAPESYCVVLGDIHGSLHSFVRILWRLIIGGFMNENLVIIDPNGYMIFTGDLVDRGHYSLEVLFLAMILKINNPDRVVILRGNHEDLNMGVGNNLYTVRQELYDKFQQAEGIERIIGKLACFYDLLPHLLLFGSNKNYFIFSHAGVDPSYNFNRLLIADGIHYECLRGKNESSPFLDEKQKILGTLRYNLVGGPENKVKMQFCCYGFTWCDFAVFKNNAGKVIYDRNKMIVGDHGYAMSLEAFNDYVASVNKELAPYGISILGHVGGHQHSSFGLMLFDPTRDVEIGQNCDWKTLVSVGDIQASKGFSMANVRCPLFKITSATEGMAHCVMNNVTSEVTKDSYCVITTGKTSKDWFIKPFEYDIPLSHPDGVYCSIVDTGDIDPIRCIYSLSPPPTPISRELQRASKFSLQDDITDETNAIFRVLKKKLNLRKMQSCEAVLKPKPLQYPLNTNIKTQSLNHLRLRAHTEIITRGLIEKFSGRGNISIVENALQQEILHPDCFVFYHAHESSLACFHDVLKFFHCWGLLNPRQPLPLGFIVRNRYVSTIDEFLEKKNGVKVLPIGNFEYIDEKGQLCTELTFDHIPEIREQLFAVNCALFGNSQQNFESRFHHFNNGRMVNNLEVEKTLESIFDQLQIPRIFLTKIMQAINAYEEHAKWDNSLLQIFIKKDVADDVAYLSLAGGMPFDQKIVASCWDKVKKRHTKIVPILAHYQEDLKAFRTLVEDDRWTEIFIDTLQARLWLPAPALYDPTKTEIIRYGTDMTNYVQYQHELDVIFQEIIRYFIKQKLTSQTAIFQHAATPLRAIDEIISNYKLEKDSHKIMQTADYLNLEMKTDPVLARPENRFLQLCNQVVRNGMNDSICDQLSAIMPLCKQLPGGETPLIHAIKIDCVPLIEFLIHSQGAADITAFDDRGRNAFAWAQIMGSRKCLQLFLKALAAINYDKLDCEWLIYCIDNTHDPAILALLLNRLVDAHCDESKSCDALLNVIKKTNNREILKLVIAVAERLSDLNGVYTMALKIMHVTDDNEILKLIITNLLGKLALSDNYVTREYAAAGASQIIAKNSKKEVVICAIAMADKLKEDQHAQFALAKDIIENANDPEVLNWAMALADSWEAASHRTDLQLCLAKRNEEYAQHLTRFLVEKLPNPCLLNWVIKMTNACIDGDKNSFAFVLTENILKRTDDAATLKWGLTIADRVGKAGDRFGSFNLIEMIWGKAADKPEIRQLAQELIDRVKKIQ